MESKTSSYILSIDQGTSGTKAVIFNEEGKAVAKGSELLGIIFLPAGFVEQNPEGIYQNVLTATENCLNEFRFIGGDPASIQACGITNQRETFVVWDKNGKPLHDAVVWQCKRSIKICDCLKQDGLENLIRDKTGLLIDPYFSATKLMWLYENASTVRSAIDGGTAYFGTIDTWLLYKLTNGSSYFTDYTNASRTLLFNLSELKWDTELLTLFGLSKLNLPELRPSSSAFGKTDFNGLLSTEATIAGMIGDSHAAAFGEGCFSPGAAKATLGTGCSILMNIGNAVKGSQHGMVTTICWSLNDRIDYAFEGVIVSCGSTIEWLKQKLEIIHDSKQTESMATSVSHNNGVYLIPAFSGLGAPHWNMSIKASISGLTFDCTKEHIIRAALESMAYQIKDVIVAMEKDAGIQLNALVVDGGITSNKFVLQFTADLLGIPVYTIGMAEVSALGAAYVAGLQTGVYKNLDQLKSFNTNFSVVHPGGDPEKMKAYYAGWTKAIRKG